MFIDSLSARPGPSRPSVPDGHRVYAVGDVHGRDDLLDELLELIEADNGRRGAATSRMVFLGDLIDRGPGSAAVIERLRTYPTEPIAPLFLLGNHEEVLLRILNGEVDLIESWLRFGGAECLRSYGVDPARLRDTDRRRVMDLIRDAIPAEHATFLGEFADTLRIGEYLFVHAGIRPGVALNDQLQSDLRWIRAPFLDAVDDHGFVVVHGHTISHRVDERDNRIGLDTGAYRSGVLTAMGVEGSGRWYLQTGGAG
ncbi:MAG: metallophosphoesterase [Sphingomonas bacterium]|nr:metallophosphoesterase [Sphingomonas bacterium]